MDTRHPDQRRSVALGRQENIVCHVVYTRDVLAMAYDIAHVCVVDIDCVMTPCVCIDEEREKTIRTCEMHITTKFGIVDESHVRT